MPNLCQDLGGRAQLAERPLTIAAAFVSAIDARAGGTLETLVTALGGGETIVVEENVKEIWSFMGSGGLVASGMDCNCGDKAVFLVEL